jgi:drug/metabolite transporter (DMT)-like permease
MALVCDYCFCRRALGNQGRGLGAVTDLATRNLTLDGQAMSVHGQVSLAGIAGSIFSQPLSHLPEADHALQRLLAARVAVTGAAIIRYDQLGTGFYVGFFLLHIGKATYSHLLARHLSGIAQYRRLGYVYLGAAFLLFGNAAHLLTSASQWWVLTWLGMVASGLGLYWWNKGASLAEMNNALVSAGLLVNLLLWNRDADLGRLSLGGAVLASSLRLARVGSRQLYVAKEMR